MTQGVWRVKFDGHCSRCGIPLSAGSPAVYDRANRTIHCIECPSASSDPAPSPLAGTEDHAPSPGTAGASARREHERRKGAREARVTERFGPRVGKVLLAIAGEESTTAVWRTGAIGEETVGLVLADVPDVRVLHDRAIPGTRANIDHIVVGPAGVFVVDAKRYRGRIEVRDRGSLFRRDLRLVIGGRDRSAIADSIGRQLEVVNRALGAAGFEPTPAVTPILCFVEGDWPIIARPRTFRGVELADPKSLVKRVRSTLVLDERAVDAVADALAAALRPR